MFGRPRARFLSAVLSCVVVGGLAGRASADEVPKPRNMSIELGAFTGLFMPSKDHDFFDPSDGRPHQRLKKVGLDSGLRLAFFPLAFVGLELEGSFIYTRTRTPTEKTVTLWSLRPSLVLQYPWLVTPFAFGGVGNTWARSGDDVLGNDDDRVIHFGAGAKFFLTDRISLRGDFRIYNSFKNGVEGETVNHYGITLGAAYHFGAAGLPGKLNVKTKVEVKVGPPPPKDTDGDGMMDPDDKCPSEPETVNQHEDTDGCPDELPDTDGDGFRGDADKCPTEAEDIDGFEDEDGCPEPDNDKDGVMDSADGCPTEAGVVENRGCPDTDKDGDTVVDRLDNCPDEAGSPANQGCKKKQLVVLTQTQLKILDKVFFATSKAKVLPRSRKLLDNIAQVLNSHPEIKKIRVEGHTDDVGDDLKNKELSQKRADAVVEYLVGKGVDPSRLEAVGFGEEKPLEDNATKKGKAANRRVEFNIIDPNAAPAEGTAPPPAEGTAPAPTEEPVKPTEGAGPPPP